MRHHFNTESRGEVLERAFGRARRHLLCDPIFRRGVRVHVNLGVVLGEAFVVPEVHGVRDHRAARLVMRPIGFLATARIIGRRAAGPAVQHISLVGLVAADDARPQLASRDVQKFRPCQRGLVARGGQFVDFARRLLD